MDGWREGQREEEKEGGRCGWVDQYPHLHLQSLDVVSLRDLCSPLCPFLVFLFKSGASLTTMEYFFKTPI